MEGQQRFCYHVTDAVPEDEAVRIVPDGPTIYVLLSKALTATPAGWARLSLAMSIETTQHTREQWLYLGLADLPRSA